MILQQAIILDLQCLLAAVCSQGCAWRSKGIILDDFIDSLDLYLKFTILLSYFQIVESNGLNLIIESDYSIAELFFAPQLVLLVVFHL